MRTGWEASVGTMHNKNEATPAARPRCLWLSAVRHRRVSIVRGFRKFHWHDRRKLLLQSALRVAVAAGLLGGATGDAQSAFDEPASSAQSAAMGGAALADMGDCAALFLNPAAGAGLRQPEAYFMFNRLYAGLNGTGGIGRGFAALGVPTRAGAVQVGFSDLQASGLLEERVLGVAFSRRWFDSVSVGVTAKYLYRRYLTGSDPAAGTDPVFQGGASRGAPALDAGLGFAVSAPLTLGLAVRNINRPDVGLAAPDRVPREFQAGLAYAVAPWALNITADYVYRDAPSGTFRDRSLPGIGLEKRLAGDRLRLRLGAALDRFGAGFGVQFGDWGLDYTVLLARTLLADNAGTHMLGLRYRFGRAARTSAGGE